MIFIDSTAREPETREALRAAIAFLARNAITLSPEQLRIGDELKRRLRRLESECNRLIKISNALMQAELPRMVHDEATDTLTMTVREQSYSIKMNRANPNIPVKLVGSTAIGTYSPGREDHSSKPEVEEVKVLFESLLEQYYYNAFRITKILQDLTGRTKVHCTAITMVRNHLIEHPKDAADYTFGYGTGGPVVRPIKRGTSSWNDPGLVANTDALGVRTKTWTD